jgi:hypothetical protein
MKICSTVLRAFHILDAVNLTSAPWSFEHIQKELGNMANQNRNYEYIKSGFNLENAYYHLVQNLSSSSPSKVAQ